MGKPVMVEADCARPLSVGNHTHYGGNPSGSNLLNISPGGVLGIVAVIVAAVVLKIKIRP